jgi:predicted ester cyclase
MSAEEILSIEKRIVDAFNLGNLDILDEVCSPNYIFHGPSYLNWDQDAIKKALGMMHAAFPDWMITFDDIFSTSDKAAFRISIQGTHKGELWGCPPTGKRMTWTAMIIDHFEDGKIVEEWEEMDFLGLMRQLGLVPEEVRT